MLCTNAINTSNMIRGNWARVVLFCCILGCLLFLICIELVYLYFPVLFCLSISVKWLAVKTASEMAYIVSSGALNSTPTNLGRVTLHGRAHAWCSPKCRCLALSCLFFVLLHVVGLALFVCWECDIFLYEIIPVVLTEYRLCWIKDGVVFVTTDRVAEVQ